MELLLLYQDDHIIAVDKPTGWFVHKTKLDKLADLFVLQVLRDQLGQRVYPLHRLDRKTSGVLLFGLDSESTSVYQQMFANRLIFKSYKAIVRGFTEDNGLIDYPLKNDRGKIQEAITNYRTLQNFELPVPFGLHATSRYSLVELIPKTGRMHQLRKHMAHIHHPIIGDRPYGCNKQNRLFKEKWGSMRMYLHATSLEFEHPINNTKICIESPLPSDFIQIFEKWDDVELL